MKKLVSLALCTVIALLAAGCGSSGSAADKAAQSSKGKTVSDVLSQAQSSQQDATDNVPPIATQVDPSKLTYPELEYEADLDLTTMSSTMVYSEVSNMIKTPSNYMGKRIKINGTFDVYTDIKTKTFYYSCIVQDATACCKSGIEFSPKAKMTYPDDFPTVNTPITVGGVFETYKEGDTTYLRLKNAEIAIAKT